LRLAAFCFVLALLIRILKPFDMTELGAYVLLPTRMDALAAGAYVALLTRSANSGPSDSKVLVRRAFALFVLCAAALAAIYAGHGGLPESKPVVYTIGFTLIASACAALLAILVSTPTSDSLHRLFSSSPLVALGRYSYSLYVVHVPVILFLRDGGLGAELFPQVFGSTLPGAAVFAAVAVAISLAIAALSFHMVESPILALKRYLPYRADGDRRDNVPTGSVPATPRKRDEVTVMVDKKSKPRYRGAEVIATAGACDAARSLKNVRLLSGDVPVLPLKTCDRPAACRCMYRHFDDRRQGPRREFERALVPFDRGAERRKRLGRRDSDYA
jgi:peptidoglycan/LPS O-acetylase OafA/YrhL